MYRILFTVTGVFAVLLGLLLLAAPHTYLWLYVLQFDDQMSFAAQRFAPAVAGLGGVLFVARDLPAGPIPARIAAVVSLVWFGVAATGVFHFLTGVSGPAILVAALTEVVLGGVFALAARQIRHG